jgi:hypothetical protein
VVEVTDKPIESVADEVMRIIARGVPAYPG